MGLTETQMAAGAIASLWDVRHENEPHVDPEEERFSDLSVMFTSHGAWTYDGPAGEVEVHPGVVLLGPPGVSYRCAHDSQAPTDRTLCLVYSVDPALIFREHYPALEQCGSYRRLLQANCIPNGPALEDARQRLLFEATSTDAVCDLGFDLTAAQLLVTLMRHVEDFDKTDHRDNRRISKACDLVRAYIDEHFRENVRLDDLSRVSGFSPFYIGREFKRQFEISPNQYLSRKRLHAAMLSLSESNEPITNVCFDAGFQSLSYFISKFSAFAGCSPSRYRSMYRRGVRKS